MRTSQQAILWYHQEARRQLLSLDVSSRRKVVDVFTRRTRNPPTQERNLNLHISPLLRQAASASVLQDESISFGTPSQTPFRPWAPHLKPSKFPTEAEQSSLTHLPLSCPGCGALTQGVDSEEAGFYTRSRRSTRDYIRRVKRARASVEHDASQVTAQQGKTADDMSQQREVSTASTSVEQDDAQAPALHVIEEDVPFCDRCHNILHQSKGVSIAHPTIDSIADTIAESPYRRNHVFHVLDAADFPLSLVPSIFSRLELARPRSQNRRSQHDFSTRTTISFIITRSDLLAPQKELVDSLMPYFISVLRQALGRKGQDMRLGNVHLVSAKRGWWTKEIKEAIYKRGGGNWMVGKFNVGKSNLFEVLFPKGYDEQGPVYSQLEREAGQDKPFETYPTIYGTQGPEEPLLPESSLLPPPQPSTTYPTLPLVSPLPGTTASPIRLPFGSRTRPKGELIDLPGLPRGNLSHYVSPEYQRTLLMEHRPTVTQHVVKAGQSLLLGGGLMRITPLRTATSNPHDETIILAYPFLPLPAHVTSTEKAIAAQLQQRESGVKTVLAPQAGDSIRSAGVFALETDVTKSRSGALLRAGVPMAKLAFRVKATDILLEGVGWVELACQVRHGRRRVAQPGSGHGRGDALSILDEPSPLPETGQQQREEEEGGNDDFPTPRVEIFTPQGRSVGQRPCMGAWMLIHGARKPGQRKPAQATARSRPRPRRSMKGAKKRAKQGSGSSPG